MPRSYRLDPADRERLVAGMEAALGTRPDILFTMVFGSFLSAEAFRDIDLAIWTSGTADGRLDVELAASLSHACYLEDLRSFSSAVASLL